VRCTALLFQQINLNVNLGCLEQNHWARCISAQRDPLRHPNALAEEKPLSGWGFSVLGPESP
jgi:hypothetical protein